MIIGKTAAKKTLAVALVLALFAGSPLTAFAQMRNAPINANVSGGVGVVGTLGAIGGVNASGSIGALALSNLSLSAPSLAAQSPAHPVLAAPAIVLRPGSVEAVRAQAVAESLPAGGVRRAMAPFLAALSDKTNAGELVSRIFDSRRTFAAQDDSSVSAEGEDGGEGVSADAAALHKVWEAAAARRTAAFEKAVEQVKSGRIGLKFAYKISDEGKLSYGYAYTLDGKPMILAAIDATLTAAGVSPSAWKAAKAEIDAAVPELLKQLVSALKQNDSEHQAVHRKMESLAKASALKSVKETLRKGADLQAWGVPISISIDQKTRLRYAKTYRLDGMPTDFGAALHDLLAPLIAADPQFLSKITAPQLHEAAQYLNDSLKYTLDGDTPDGMKRIRMSGGREGFDYPESRKALVDLARRKLTEAPLPGDLPAGLAATPEAIQPAPVMRGVLADLMKTFQGLTESNPAQEEVERQYDLLAAMHAAMGVPVQTSQGMTMLPITHRQLKPILEELARRNAPSEVVSAVIRAFPLGESLIRLGIDKVWAQGVTGKGIKVAVIDNGVDFTHPDMADIQNPVNENMTRDRGVHTKGEHGTPMASIIHAIAPDAEIQSYQALPNTDGLPGVALSEQETVQAVLKAMDRAAANGANIISMSLGFPMAYADDPVARKVTELTKKGIVVIVSAGNEGGDLPKGMQIRSPASSPDAIAVGAVDYHGKIAPFSSEGVVFNPAEGTAAEKPDIYASGVNIKAAMLLPGPVYAQESVPYNHVSGTSPAAPHVSGVAALMLSAALAAGADVANAAIPGAVRQGLAAGVRRIERLPVLSDADAAIKALVKLLTPGA